MIRRPPRSTLSSSSAASDVYKRQLKDNQGQYVEVVRMVQRAIVRIRKEIMSVADNNNSMIEYLLAQPNKQKSTLEVKRIENGDDEVMVEAGADDEDAEDEDGWIGLE